MSSDWTRIPRLRNTLPIYLKVLFEPIFVSPFICHIDDHKVLFLNDQMTDDIQNTLNSFDVTRMLTDEEKKCICSFVADWKCMGPGLREDQMRIN